MAKKRPEDKDLASVRTDEEVREQLPDLDIAEDDYTDDDERGRRRNASAAASASRTAGLDGKGCKEDRDATRRANRAKRRVGAVLGIAAVGSIRTDRMGKRAAWEQAAIERDQRRMPRGAGQTFGDVFADAFARIQMEQRMERLKKLQQKVQSRIQRSQRIGAAVGGVVNSVGQAARTKAMQRSMEQFTAGQSGMTGKDLVTATSGRGDEVSQPTAGRDAEPQLG